MSSRLRRSLVLTTLLALLLGAAGTTAPIGFAANAPDTRVAGIDVDATTIPELQEFMDADRLKSVQLTQFYLHRIRKLNPTLNAVITVSPTALADARAADKARRDGDDRPLLGIPIIVKDNVNTTGMPTTAGSWALAGSTPDDAFIVKQLKAPARSSSAKPTSPNGQLPVRPVVERLELHRWPNEHALCPRSQPVRLELRLRRRCGCRSRGRRPSARRRTARSSARPAPTASSGSSRHSGCGAAQASSRSAPTRTRPARWPAT
jgi:hypothetical protein